MRLVVLSTEKICPGSFHEKRGRLEMWRSRVAIKEMLTAMRSATGGESLYRQQGRLSFPDYSSLTQRLRVSMIFWAWALLEMLNLDLGRYCPFSFW